MELAAGAGGGGGAIWGLKDQNRKEHAYDNSDIFKREMISVWLKLVDDVKKFGRPSWKRLVDAVQVVDEPVAENIVKQPPWNN